MKNKWLIGLGMLLGVLGFSACSGGGSDDNGGGGSTETPAPKMVSSSPTDGSVDLATGELTVRLTMDQNVTCPSANKGQVSMSGATVGSIDAYLKEITVKVSGLEAGQTYQLIFPKGTIAGPTGVAAEAITLTFKTKAKPVLATALCNPNATTQATKVYNFLLENYGVKTLSATMANVAWNIAEAELVYKATGKYPAMATFDYIHLASSPSSWIDYTDTKVAEDWWNANGLIAAGWHWNVPRTEADTDALNFTCTPGDGNVNSSKQNTTTFRPKNIFVEGSWENKTANADLEKLAGYLKLLQDKNIPLIWRPFHEAAGNTYEYTGGTAWFWWGIDGAETYKKLWIYVFDYLKDKGINNLIWVWTSQTKDADWYPGDAYVDIVGTDIYGRSNNNYGTGSGCAERFNTLKGSFAQKMITLSECGSVGKISEQWGAGARWMYFMPWYQYDATTLDGHEHADTAWWKDAMSQSYVITRDQMPSLK